MAAPLPALLPIALLLAQCAAPPPPAPHAEGIPSGPPASTASLRGRVLEAFDLRPVPGARVSARGTDVEVESGADGSYLLEGVPPGLRGVQVRPVDHQPLEVRHHFTAGETRERDLFVLEGETLEGVVRTAGGRPVAGASVATRWGSRTTADDRGRFRLRGLFPAESDGEAVRVAAPGFGTQLFRVPLPPGFSPHRHDFELQPAWRIEGRVLRGGMPVAGVVVAPAPDDLELHIAGTMAVTDAEGRFLLESPCGGRGLRLVAREEDELLVETPPIAVVPGTTVRDVVLTLPVLGRIEGIVRCPGGLPPEEIDLHAEPVDPRYGAYEGAPRFPLRGARPSADGSFRLRLPPGEWILLAGKRLAIGPTVEVARVAVSAASRTTPLEIEIPAEAFGKEGWLRGRVRDEEGRPVEGARVHGIGNPVLTDSEGRFDLRVSARFMETGDALGRAGGDPMGLELLVEREGFLATSVPGLVPDRPVADVVLRKGATLRGRVVLPDGITPARCFAVEVRDDEGGAAREFPARRPDGPRGLALPASMTISAADGRFEVPDLPGGRVAVIVRSGDLAAPMVRGLELVEGAVAPELRLQVGPAPALVVEVRDGEGHPVPGARVHLLAEAAGGEFRRRPVRSGVADAEGCAEFRVLLEGSYGVALVDDDGTEISRTPVVVAPGATTRAALSWPGTGTGEGPPAPPPRLEPAAWIAVTVLGADGRPATGVERGKVYVLPAGSPGVEALEDVPSADLRQDGPTTLPLSGAGVYDVAALCGLRFAVATDVAVERGATVGVTLRLPASGTATFLMEAAAGGVEVESVTLEPPAEVRTFPGHVPPPPGFPGRGEAPRAGVRHEWPRPFSPLAVELPLDRDFRYSIRLRPAAGPGSFVKPPWGWVRAGETVRLEVVPTARLRLRFVPDAEIPPGTALAVSGTVAVAGTGVHYSVRSGPGEPGGALEVEVEAPAGTAAVLWHPTAWPSYERAVAFPEGALEGILLAPGETVTREIPLAIDATGAMTPTPVWARPVRIEAILPGGGPAPAEGSALHLLRPGAGGGSDGSRHETALDGVFLLPATSRSENTHLFLVHGAGFVSDLLPFPLTENLSVGLRPAGLLRVELDALPAEGTGRLMVRRTDGGILPVFSGGKVVGADLEVPVEHGTVLGPFRAGRLLLEVTLGGRALPGAAATVEPGRTVPLPLRIAGE